MTKGKEERKQRANARAQERQLMVDGLRQASGRLSLDEQILVATDDLAQAKSRVAEIAAEIKQVEGDLTCFDEDSQKMAVFEEVFDGVTCCVCGRDVEPDSARILSWRIGAVLLRKDRFLSGEMDYFDMLFSLTIPEVRSLLYCPACAGEAEADLKGRPGLNEADRKLHRAGGAVGFYAKGLAGRAEKVLAERRSRLLANKKAAEKERERLERNLTDLKQRKAAAESKAQEEAKKSAERRSKIASRFSVIGSVSASV